MEATTFPALTSLGQEEIEELCNPVEIQPPLSKEDWNEMNGIRFLKCPIKVSLQKWRDYTTDCESIVAGEMGFHDVFVFVYIVREEYSANLSEFFLEHCLGRKGYRILDGELSI